MKKEKYLKSLRKYLESKKFKNTEKVIEKYDKLIVDKLNDGKNINEIINSFKSAKEIYFEENSLSSKTPNIFKKFKINNMDFKKINFYMILLYFLVVLFSLTFTFNLITFFSSLFLILDGSNIFGITLLLFSLIILNIIILFLLNKKIINCEINYNKYLKIVLLSIIVFAFSITLLLFQFYQLEKVNDVSEKYEMKTVEKNIVLSTDNSKKYYVYFNSWYDNKYIIHYDNTLSNKIKIKLEYYECFYNSVIKNKSNSIYLSLVKDKKDLLSFYIENLKEKKIYNAKELSRNVINIYVSEEDYKRIVFVE